MNERIKGSDHQQLQYFISESPWDHKPVLKAVRQDISHLFEGRAELVGLILDESGHRKGGKQSVGVTRQYLGSIGKVDNGQVGVFAALVQGDDVGMVNSRLYLPKELILPHLPQSFERKMSPAGGGFRGWKTAVK